jgi:DNA polymerase III epsilon subunit-like protein
MITIWDTETTGLILPKGNDLSVQPHIIEIYAIQVDDEGKIAKELHTLIKPPISIPGFITKINTISDYDVRDAPVFSEVYKKICEVFFESHTSVAHNESYDRGMLINELKRIGKEFNFPYPPISFCTVEQSMWVKGFRLKNGELYKIATGKEIIDAHQAKNDVLATYESYKWLINKRRKNV